MERPDTFVDNSSGIQKRLSPRDLLRAAIHEQMRFKIQDTQQKPLPYIRVRERPYTYIDKNLGPEYSREFKSALR